MTETRTAIEIMTDMCKDAEYVISGRARELFTDRELKDDGSTLSLSLLFMHDDLYGKFMCKYDLEKQFIITPLGTDARSVFICIYTPDIASSWCMFTYADIDLLAASFHDDVYEFSLYDKTTSSMRRLTREEYDNFTNKRAKILSDFPVGLLPCRQPSEWEYV